MRLVHGLAPLLGFTLILAQTTPGQAACDPTTDPDSSDIAAARAAVTANCDCAGATTHGAYVSCAVQQIDATLANRSCRGRVKRCAARSTCGRPDFATCCRTARNGSPKCKVMRSAAACMAKGGTPGTCTSCCDACPEPGTGPSCPVTTTSTTTTTTTTTAAAERCCFRSGPCTALDTCEPAVSKAACFAAAGVPFGVGSCTPNPCWSPTTTTPPSACCVADQCLFTGLCECFNIHHGTFMLFQLCQPGLCTTTTLP